MGRLNTVLYTIDQRADTTEAEKKVARDNIGAISFDDVQEAGSGTFKTKQYPIDMHFAANAIIDRITQNANGEINAHCNYIYNATDTAAGLMSPYDKAKLDGIAYGAEVNVQADWNVTDDTSDAYIRNKPNLNMFVTHDELGARLDAKQDVLTPGRNITIENNVISATADPQEQADWAQNDSTAVDYIKNKPQNLVQDADYVHTDNNFTTAEKNKLSGIEAGAEANVQSDWAQANSSADDFIKNKPDLSVYATTQDLTTGLSGKQDTLTPGNNITITNNVISATADPQVQADWAQSNSSAVDYIKNKPQNLVQDANYVHTDNNFTNADKTKLDSVESGAEANVQADWNEADSAADDYIKNKPQNLVQDASYVHTDNNFTTAEKNKLAGIEAGAEANVQADWTEADSAADSFILHKPNLATVATSGSYNDLTDKPTIPSVPVQGVEVDGTSVVNAQGVAEIDLTPYAKSADLATVASTGDYDDLINKPSIPAAQVNSDWNASSGVAQILNKPNLATVATSGSYNDLTDKPSIPAAQVNSDWNAVSGVAQILNKPTLASVATSGSYNDLTDKPSIPAAQVQSNWTEADSTDPSYIQNKPNLATVATSGDYNDLSNRPAIIDNYVCYLGSSEQALWNAWLAGKLIFFIQRAELSPYSPGHYGKDSIIPLYSVAPKQVNGHTVYEFSFARVSAVDDPGYVASVKHSFLIDPNDLSGTLVGGMEIVTERFFQVVAGTTQKNLYDAMTQGCAIVYMDGNHALFNLATVIPDTGDTGYNFVFTRVGCSSASGTPATIETATIRVADPSSTSAVVITANTPIGFPLMQWQQQTQGATNTFSADKLSIHQDFHTVTMHDATNGDVDLGYVAPALPSAPATDKFLKMGSGSTTPIWADAPEGHTVGFITVA